MTDPRDALVGPTDERVLLDTFLDSFHAALVRKVDGVSDEDAALPGVPSGTSLLWLVQHMVLVEQNWFMRVLHGMELERRLPTPDEPLRCGGPLPGGVRAQSRALGVGRPRHGRGRPQAAVL
ncbi:MAG: DinB family protein [Actinobacteria bacterium]|nr:DinB family protein [Actinomycetota bacterium]